MVKPPLKSWNDDPGQSPHGKGDPSGHYGAPGQPPSGLPEQPGTQPDHYGAQHRGPEYVTPPPPPPPGEPLFPGHDGAPNGSANKRRVSATAVTGFVLALVMAPVGFVVSLCALPRTGRNKARGRGLAIAGVVVGAVLTGVLVFGGLFALEKYQQLKKAADIYTAQGGSIGDPVGPNLDGLVSPEQAEEYGDYVAAMKALNVPGMENVKDNELIAVGMAICFAESLGQNAGPFIASEVPQLTEDQINQLVGVTKEKLCTKL